MDLPGDQGSRHVRESGFWNPGNFCLWNPESGKFCESGILAFEIRRAAQRIRNATNDWNLQSIQVSERRRKREWQKVVGLDQQNNNFAREANIFVTRRYSHPCHKTGIH